jgi:predicted peptidase
MTWMRTFSVSVSCLLLGLSTTLAQEPAAQNNLRPREDVQTAHVFQYTPRPVHMEYLLFLPEGYDARANKQWPLILFLHGADHRGTNVQRPGVRGPSKYIASHPDFPFILITPLCPAGETWSNEDLIALLDGALKDYRVDPTRVYLTGLSMGGSGTWALGMKHPDRFAAIAPICGPASTLDITLARLGYAPDEKSYIQSLPVWAFHGAQDQAVPLSESERMVKALEAVGAKAVKLTVYPEAQHDSWSETYNNPELYDWFLQHQRKPVAKLKE